MALRDEFDKLDGPKLADMFEATLDRLQVGNQLADVLAQVKGINGFRTMAEKAKQDVLAYSFGDEANAAAVFTGVIVTLAALSDYAENEALGARFTGEET